jgi:hypothetical protein
MKLALTIDVEEEGLFSGKYQTENVSVHNVKHLDGLAPALKDLGVRPTLLLSYRAAAAQQHHELYHQWQENLGAEIGAHLHPWNTPPLVDLPHPQPVPSEYIPQSVLKDKLDTLLETLAAISVKPTSFRMGRFNLGPKIFSLLPEAGIKVDSSVAPMHRYYGGPDHLTAPSDPYHPNPNDPGKPGYSPILEVPMTIQPLHPNLGGWLLKLEQAGLAPPKMVSWFAQYLGSLSCQPVGMGLRRLKAAARLHQRRNGRTITLFFHSTEVAPGYSPQHPTAKESRAFIRKLIKFLEWLQKDLSAEPVTLSELAK